MIRIHGNNGTRRTSFAEVEANALFGKERSDILLRCLYRIIDFCGSLTTTVVAIKFGQFIGENTENLIDQALLLFRGAGGEAEELSSPRRVLFQLYQAQRSNGIGEGGVHFLRDAAQQDFLLLHL